MIDYWVTDYHQTRASILNDPAEPQITSNANVLAFYNRSMQHVKLNLCTAYDHSPNMLMLISTNGFYLQFSVFEC